MLTEEEKRRLFLAQMRGEDPNPQMSPVMQGTIGPYQADAALMEMANQDFSDRESQLAGQKKMAQAMMGREGPQGRTVGPYDVYMGPNWGEALGSAAEKIGGGLLSRSANKRGEALSADKKEAVLAKAKMDANRRAYEDQIAEQERQRAAARAAEAAALQARRVAAEEGRLANEGRKLEHELSQPNAQLVGADQLLVDVDTGETIAEGKPKPGSSALTKDQNKRIDSATSRIENLQKTYDQYNYALEALAEGAATGPIVEMFPTFRESTRKLETAADQIAMDKIGEQTFGSLSEAEADWLRRVSVPMGLDEKEVEAFVKKEQARIETALEAERYKIEQIEKGLPIDQEVLDGYRQKFLEGFEEEEDSSAEPPPPGVDPKVWKHMNEEERALWRSGKTGR